jgi:hypothetical protein
VQPAEQPDQQNDRQRNADQPKQQSASHDVYSCFPLHKLKATTILELNRSACDRSQFFSFVARFKVVARFIWRIESPKAQELITDAKRYRAEKILRQK